MNDKFNNLTIKKNANLKDVILKLNENGRGFVAIISDDNKLYGIITDGDIRRAFLEEKTALEEVINKVPKTMKFGTPVKYVISKLKQINQRYMPLVNENNILRDIVILNDDDFNTKSNYVVIMAGGVGSRMGDLTKEIPKPMLKLGKKTILEMIISDLVKQGFINIFLTVNYKSNIIKNYFKDGKNFGANIKYIEEEKQLGTGGSLSLINNENFETVIVINGDVLVNLNYQKLIDIHNNCGDLVTICVRKFKYQIPFGVIKSDMNSKIIDIDEKPIYNYFVNSGIYALSPETIKMIPKNKYFDLPDIYKILKDKKRQCNMLEIDDYWQDIGVPEIYNKIKNTFDYYNI